MTCITYNDLASRVIHNHETTLLQARFAGAGALNLSDPQDDLDQILYELFIEDFINILQTIFDQWLV